MRFFFLPAAIQAAFVLASVAASAQGQSDTTRVEALEASVVQAVRASKEAPFAVSNIELKDLEDFSKTGKEIPFLLSTTPGVLSWSENGVGTGTTFLRIRGAGDSRINVTIDGVPLNSPEDQAVFWANMNSYSHFLESIQIQRGVGTSTNGDGAFGGSVALKTKGISYDPYVRLDASYGSYNTCNTGFSMSTGPLGRHLVADAAFHTTGTDGFVHGTSGKSGSWYGGLTWLGRDIIVKYRNIGNYEHTGQAWNGITAGTGDLSIMDGTYGERTGIKTYKDMYDAGLGKYNSLYESLTITPLEQKTAGSPYSYSTSRYQLNDGSLWPRTTDNFWQDHNILSASWAFAEYWNTSLSLHYTYGYGYYEEFRYNNKLSKFGLPNVTDASGKTIKRADFIRKKGLSQNAGGAVWNIKYDSEDWNLIGGVSAQLFSGNHFGHLTYVSDPVVTAALPDLAGLDNPDYRHNGYYTYYDSDAWKNDYSAFVKVTRKIGERLNIFADLQFRHVDYRTDGINDKFYEEGGRWYNQPLDIDKHYNFPNPKLGFSYNAGNGRLYASYALANREPERNNFTDNGSYPAPEPEKVNDYELGYQLESDRFQGGINLYYMDYDGQFVQTGAVSDIGETLTTNIKDSYRAGVELSAICEVTPWLTFDANAALSTNRIKDFDEVVEDWDNEEQTIHYDNSTLAFSPSAILNGSAIFRIGKATATWHTSFVSRQYLDNTTNIDRSLPAYSLSDIKLRYPVKFRKGLLKEFTIGADMGNVFGARVATSGWVYSAIYGSGGHPNDNRYYQIGFVPAAGRTFMGSISLKF